jgi:hypothetical protein
LVGYRGQHGQRYLVSVPQVARPRQFCAADVNPRAWLPPSGPLSPSAATALRCPPPASGAPPAAALQCPPGRWRPPQAKATPRETTPFP